MRIFFASGYVYMYKYEKERILYDLGVRDRLYSYLFTKDRYWKTFEECTDKKMYNFMIDSGAYTVHKRGETIDIVAYADWLLKVKDRIEIAVNLDVIPKTVETVEKSATEGWENLQYLQSRGLKILPVFHLGESYKWLQKFIDNYEYFGLSKTGRLLTRDQQLLWLDSCWKKLIDRKGKPIRKIHGFGITQLPITTRYPWYSVDSSTWGMMSIYGRVLVPPVGQSYTEPIYGGIYVSKYSPTQRKKYAHYKSLSSQERKVVDNYFASIGMDIELIINEEAAELKTIANVKYFLGLEKRLSKEPLSRLDFQKGFFEEEDYEDKL